MPAGWARSTRRATPASTARSRSRFCLPHLAESPEFRARFDREARAISALNHPHICTLYDVGERRASDGAPIGYLVMELVEGETLAARLRRGPLPLDQALALAAQMADASIARIARASSIAI